MSGRSIIPLWLGLVLLAICGADKTALARSGAGDDAGGIEFFEKSIRPILAEKCQKCHGGDKAKGGLSLIGRESLLRGGDSGPAAVPGKPRDSLLIAAVEHRGELKMPPKGKLTPGEIERLGRWIERGLPWPEAEVQAGSADRDAARSWWCFQRVRAILPPRVKDTGQPHSEIDRFILAGLEARGLRPAEPAGKRTLIRRVTFDLTGLPPTPGEVEAFLADESPDAFARVVDRLLASPRYGERWARHWLDLVRYTDEFDEVWRYRDWVIRAFNDDMPYDRFVIDQVAGDLVPASAPNTVNADGIVATTVLAIGPWGGIDRTKRLADIVDDQIDTIGRSFLGLTIACARCHDHKFDPIPTADYYGLAGFFFSSRILSDLSYLSHRAPRLKVPLAPASLVEEHRRRTDRVREAEDRLQAAVDRHYAAFARGLLPRLADYLLAAWDYSHRPADQAGLSAEEFANGRGVQGFALKGWIDYLAGARAGAFRRLDRPVRDYDGERGVAAWMAAAERPWWAYNGNDHDVAIETFLLPPRSVSVNPGVEGGAVGWRSPVSGTVRVAGRLTDGDPYDGTGVAWAIDHLTKDGRHQLASGRLPNGGSMRVDQGRLADGLAAVRVEAGDVIQLGVALGQGDAHYDITNVELTISLRDRPDEWDLARDARADFLASNSLGVWQFDDMAGSHRVGRLPALDRRLAGWDAAVAVGAGNRSAIETAARELVGAVNKSLSQETFVREGEAPAEPLAHAGSPGGSPSRGGPRRSPGGRGSVRAVEGRAAHREADPDDALIRELTSVESPFWVKDRDDGRYLAPEARAELEKLTGELDAVRARVPSLSYASGIQEGGPRYGPYPGIQDARIYIRGNDSQPGRRVPRHFPEALAHGQPPRIAGGSGRLELARWIARADNPMTARVMVNRLWQHHFGEGIVRTPSNFGRKGAPPSHSELLDWLARRFVESGWSIKAMHRLIVLSAAYQRSSQSPAALLEADPEDRLFGRMVRRRLEAEELHDSLLALAGRLDVRPGGPAESDGNRPRRLIYLGMSRSDRSDFGSVFDRANPSLHVERRTASTVAPQALYLMNHPWMLEQARGLARRPEVAAAADPARRIAILHRLVYGRPATDEEVALGRGFIADAPAGADAQAPWDLYAQALLLTNEFLFVD